MSNTRFECEREGKTFQAKIRGHLLRWVGGVKGMDFSPKSKWLHDPQSAQFKTSGSLRFRNSDILGF